MKNRALILISILIFTGCDSSKTKLDSTTSTEVENIDKIMNERNKDLFESAETIIKNKRVEVRTVNFRDFESNDFIARLYLFSDGKIIHQIDRVNLKYHSGTFLKSDQFENLGDVIMFKNVIPSSSVPHFVLDTEYFVINNNKLYSFLKYTALEKDCGLDDTQGKLIMRNVEFSDDTYILTEEEFGFDCKDFNFEESVENKILLNVHKKEINITIPTANTGRVAKLEHLRFE